MVGELALALRAQGHEVVVYATGDSALPGIEIRHYFVNSQWPPASSVEETHAAWCLRDIARDPRGFDVVHLHCPAAVPLARHLRCPVLYTLHHDVDPVLSAAYLEAPQTHLVAISRAQEAKELAPICAVVHHGLDPSRFAPAADEGYLLFLGRYDRCKGPDLALDVAQRSGLPLVMAGAPHEPGFWENEIKPRLAIANAIDMGPVGGRRKASLIARARALIFPVRWDEPFGLVMIESMLSGVPVLGLSRGSVPEVIDDGITGLCCNTVEEMSQAASLSDKIFDRVRVRAHAQRRWSSARMADDYASLYASFATDDSRTRRLTSAEPGEVAANS